MVSSAFSWIKLTEKQSRQIVATSYLKKSEYYNLELEKTLNYIVKRYIHPIQNYLKYNIKDSTLVDCGAGFGWLSFGYLMCGGKHATLCDIDEPRLKNAKQIAKILGIEDGM